VLTLANLSRLLYSARLVWWLCVYPPATEWKAKITNYSAPNAGRSCKLQKGNAKERLERGSGKVRATGRIISEARRGGSCGSSGWVQVQVGADWQHNGRRLLCQDQYG
jgi:hypothetical protein